SSERRSGRGPSAENPPAREPDQVAARSRDSGPERTQGRPPAVPAPLRQLPLQPCVALPLLLECPRSMWRRPPRPSGDTQRGAEIVGKIRGNRRHLGYHQPSPEGH